MPAAPKRRRIADPSVRALASRLRTSEVVVLARPIWAPSIARRLDPPAAVLVDGATADWLRASGRAMTAAAPPRANARSRPVDLGDDHDVASANVEPGERYWFLYEVDDGRAKAAKNRIAIGGRSYVLQLGQLAEPDSRPTGAASVIAEDADPDFHERKRYTVSLRLPGSGSPDDPGARELLRRAVRGSAIRTMIDAASTTCTALSGLPEHERARELLRLLTAIVRRRMGPGGQLADADATTARQHLEEIERLALQGQIRRERRLAKERRAKGGRQAATKRKGEDRTAEFDAQIVAAYRQLSRTKEPRTIVAILAKRTWQRPGGYRKLHGVTIRKMLKKRVDYYPNDKQR